MTAAERFKSDDWKREKERIENSILVWWKNYYKISRADERYRNVCYHDIYEDFLEYLVLNEEALSPTMNDKSEDLKEWEQEIWNDPSKFEEWAKKQQDKIKQVNAQL